MRGQLLFAFTSLLTVGSSHACKTMEDCSLAGTCSAGQCECFAGFLPPDCGALALGVSQRAWLPDESRTTWGGSPIKDTNGTYHLFASMNRWGAVDTWENSSVIVHATSKAPAGPYGNHTVILGNRSSNYFDGDAVQNPVALQLHDHSVALFYVGISCHMSNEGYSSHDCEDSANSSLGVAHAPSPHGPWTRSEISMLTAARNPMSYEGDALANPAAIQEDDGSILFAYRGRHDEVLATATAPDWAGPYRRVSEAGSSIFPYACLPQYCNDTICLDDKSRLTGAVRDISSRHEPGLFDDKFRCLEDPFLLRLHDGSYHMILHNQVGDSSGAHAFSPDGQRWKLSQTPAYTLTVKWVDGGSEKLYRREEPKLLFEDGYATHLFNAACRSGPKPNPNPCGEVMATQLLEPIALWKSKREK